MRPIALHAEGFGVFREPVDIDFDGVDYFALVGPTGVGKSTVIDALCFALYGSVPRYGDERLTARVVSIGKQEAKCVLEMAAPKHGYFVGPAIFRDVDPRNRIAQEEIFGPVLAVIKAKDFAQALAIANEPIR